MMNILAEQDSDLTTRMLKPVRRSSIDIGVSILESTASEPMQFPDPGVHKIAILQADRLGNLVSVLPGIQALRFAYPNAEIVFLGLDWHKEFLTGRPGVIDRVEAIPKSQGIGYGLDVEEDPEEHDQFFKRMQAEDFDLALQLHDGGRYANPFVKRLGAGLSVGLRSHDAIPLDRWILYHLYQSESLRYLEVVSLVGANLVSLEPHLVVTEEDFAEAASVISPSDRPLAVFQPGANEPRRRWPAENFARVGNALAWAGAHVVLVGSNQQAQLNDEVVKSMSAEAENLAGRLSLKGLAGLLSQASVTVSNDSDILHFAAAFGSATVGIYWCADMVTTGSITRTHHRPAISWRVNCPVCGRDSTRNDCKHEASFVSEIQDIEVATSALELLKMPLQSTRMFYQQK